MLPDQQHEIVSLLITAQQKLRKIVVECEFHDNCIRTLSDISRVQDDLKIIAVSMLRCQILTSLETLSDPLTPDIDGEIKKVCEQYQIWLMITS